MKMLLQIESDGKSAETPTKKVPSHYRQLKWRSEIETPSTFNEMFQSSVKMNDKSRKVFTEVSSFILQLSSLEAFTSFLRRVLV